MTGGLAKPSNGANPSTLVLSYVIMEVPKDGNIPTFGQLNKK